MCDAVTAPEFCANPGCPYFSRREAAGKQWYRRAGSYHTLCRGDIQRFRCLYCGKGCSTQTFSIHYWTHSTCDMRRLREDLDRSSGLRQIARRWSVCYRVVQNRIRRLARNALALLHSAASDATLGEDLVIDGFESFLRSQYFPTNYTIAAGSTSQYLWGFSLTTLRRKGRMTQQQRQRRTMIDAHWRPAARAVSASLQLLLGGLCPAIERGCTSGGLRTIRSDEHRGYPPALRSLAPLRRLLREGRLRHLQVSSRRARTRANPLFAVNYIDRQI
ncbi:MAG: hypothetical protein EA384_00445, partial [Spirochaetaceae bacterium]